MHSKLMLLFYEHYMRIVIPSANLRAHDWGEDGILENTIFLIDLPRLPPHLHNTANPTLTPFYHSLQHYLTATGIDAQAPPPSTSPSTSPSPSSIHSALLKFDFSKTAHLAFIHTICGSHFGPEATTTGFPQLASAVSALGLDTKSEVPMQVDFAASSIGALTEGRVEEIRRALRGRVVLPSAPVKRAVKGQATLNGKIGSGGAKGGIGEQFRVFYPSHQTIASSRGGEDGAGTIFITPSHHSPSFPWSCFRDHVSTRKGLLSHNKIILARTPTTAFFYTGSANFSQAAWGNLTFKKGEGPKLMCQNWECGVLVKVRGREAGRGKERENEDKEEEDEGRDGEGEDGKGGGREVLPMSVFDGVIDVPFEWPGRRYEEGVRPWVQPR